MINRELQEIQNKLNEEFEKDSTRIVFWYDDKADYEEDIKDLQLDDVKIHILDGSNYFYTKYSIEVLEKDSKILIYAPFPKPEDRNNHLADVQYYSTQFYTDRISQLCQKLNIPNKYKERLQKYGAFWQRKERISKFVALEIDKYNNETIDIGILSVLANVKTANFEEIVKQIIINDDYSHSSCLKEFKKMNILDSFWSLCNKYFGYYSENPNMEELVISLIITYLSFGLKGGMVNSLEKYVLSRKNDAVVFIKSIMNNILCSQKYDEIAALVSKKVNIEKKLSSVNLDYIVGCDCFEIFDVMIINWILEKLQEELLDEKVKDMNISEICKERMKNSYHYNKKFGNEYKILCTAYNLMKKVNEYESKITLKEMVHDYKNDTYIIDSYYRWFYEVIDTLDDNEKYYDLRVKVENIYSNCYLDKIVPKWNEVLVSDGYNNNCIPMQKDFFNTFVKSYVGKERIIVIISDALRYECAKELVKKFKYDEKCEAEIDTALSVLPSYTALGMASLLPNKEIEIDEKINVLVDNCSSNDIKAREKILKKYNDNAACFRFDELAKAKRNTVRECLKGKDIVYIYHNQIDARGEELVTENEVFKACSEAISEIQRLIRKLTSDISAYRYIITSDHGFIYKRDKLNESNKVDIKKSQCLRLDKRYILSQEELNIDGTVSRSLKYLGKDNDMYVTTPIGCDVFKAASGGQNYVHGGSSIQEMLIPIVQVKTTGAKMETDYVNVELTSITRKVTNLITYFDFIQTERVTDTMKGRNVVAFFTTEDGEKISFDVPMMANSKDIAAQKRVFHEKFIFKSKSYLSNETYYLVIADAEDEKNILNKYEFKIDIAFANDFGF